MKYIYTILFLILFNSCSNNEIVIKRTAHELVTEFSYDWKRANKFYKGKKIEISGIMIYKYRLYIGLGEFQIGDFTIGEYLENNIVIECEFISFDNMNYFELDKETVILGEYNYFNNYKGSSGIILKKCVPIVK